MNEEKNENSWKDAADEIGRGASSPGEPAKRVLLVDDEEPVLRSLLHLFSDEGGYELETAATGWEALSKVTAFSPDVVVLDMKMSVPDGFDILRMIRDEVGRGMKVVVYSGVIPKELTGQLYGEGAHAFVDKTSDPQFLLDVVAALCRDCAS